MSQLSDVQSGDNITTCESTAVRTEWGSSYYMFSTAHAKLSLGVAAIILIII